MKRRYNVADLTTNTFVLKQVTAKDIKALIKDIPKNRTITEFLGVVIQDQYVISVADVDESHQEAITHMGEALYKDWTDTSNELRRMLGVNTIPGEYSSMTVEELHIEIEKQERRIKRANRKLDILNDMLSEKKA